MQRRVWLEIDLAELRTNYRKIAKRVQPARVLCVLKANAYGLGVAPIARALAREDVAGFGVAEPFEALQLVALLREMGAHKDVQILSSILPDEIVPMVEQGVTLPIIDYPTAQRISMAARRLGVQAKVQLKLDTGMGRLGIRATEAPRIIARVMKLPNLNVDGIFSHCPMAYDPDNDYTHRQIASFAKLITDLAQKGIRFRVAHVAASDAINNFSEGARAPFNQVRTGINLHGSFDPNGRRALKLTSVLTLKTRVAQVRTLPAGATLGYGRTWCLDKPTRIATISAGYADGLPLALSNRGRVIIRGVACPVIGRISMDYTTVDVSGVENVAAGDEVICLGTDKRQGGGVLSITPDDWATLKGTHAYEVICAFGNRVERVHING